MTALAIKQSNDTLSALISECRSQTSPNPFQPAMMIWNDCVGVELTRWQGRVHISSIMTFVDKNKGNASACMRWLCALADKHQVALELEPVPIQNAGARDGTNLNKKTLTAWYTRCGFKKTDGDMMVRQPSTVSE